MRERLKCKAWFVLTALLAVALLAACAPAATPTPTEAPPPPEATPTPPPPEPTPTPSEKPIYIAFFVPLGEDPWYAAVVFGAEQRAAELGVQLDVFDAAYSIETQLAQFDTVMAVKPDAIVVSAVDPAAMVVSVESAYDAGIVVVNYDRPMWTTTKLDAMLVLDTPQIGTLGGEIIVDYLTKKYGEPKGKVIRVYGDLADTWVTDISEGWDGVMANYPNIEVLQALSGAWEQEKAAASVDLLLVTHPDVDAIFCGDWLTYAVIPTLESAGYGKAGEENHIFYVSQGGSPPSLAFIREGWEDAVISNPLPDFGGAAVEMAYMLAKGETLPAQWVEEGKRWSPAPISDAEPTADKPYAGPVLNMVNVLVDANNVDDPTLWGNIMAEE